MNNFSSETLISISTVQNEELINVTNISQITQDPKVDGGEKHQRPWLTC
jgi:hypothetical protein